MTDKKCMLPHCRRCLVRHTANANGICRQCLEALAVANHISLLNRDADGCKRTVCGKKAKERSW